MTVDWNALLIGVALGAIVGGIIGWEISWRKSVLWIFFEP